MKFYTYAAILLFSISTASAQEASVAAGGDASGAGGSVAYTLGQVVYTSDAGAGGTSSQGVQQPYEIYLLDVKNSWSNISLSVFPNPTTDYLTLDIKDLNPENLSYRLFDIQGKLLETKRITASQTQINTDELPSASYLLSISAGNDHIQTFKIIKK